MCYQVIRFYIIVIRFYIKIVWYIVKANTIFFSFGINKNIIINRRNNSYLVSLERLGVLNSYFPSYTYKSLPSVEETHRCREGIEIRSIMFHSLGSIARHFYIWNVFYIEWFCPKVLYWLCQDNLRVLYSDFSIKLWNFSS